MNKEFIIKILQYEGYPSYMIENTICKLENLSEPIKTWFSDWLKDKNVILKERIYGFSFIELVENYKMKEIGAFITLDWLKREPEHARKKLSLHYHLMADRRALEIIELERSTQNTHIFEDSVVANNTTEFDDAEFGAIKMMLSRGENIIQRHLSNPENAEEYHRKLWSALDSALDKMPRFIGTHLSRAEFYIELNSFKKGQQFTHPFYLTTSQDDNVVKSFSKDKVKFYWDIELSNNTKAVEMPNYCFEQQIEIPRNTTFEVLDIDFVNSILYVKEI